MSNESAVKRDSPMLTNLDIGDLDQTQRNRLRSLIPVDRLVGALVRELAIRGCSAGVLIVLTSDHGHSLGMHREPKRRAPYLAATNVSCMVAGAVVPRGPWRSDRASTVDLAPTLSSAAGVAAAADTDGASRWTTPWSGDEPILVQLPLSPHDPRTSLRDASGDPPLRGEHATGRRQLHRWDDLAGLENVAAITAPAVLPSPSARLALLCACAGPTCRALALREG